jgi:hypothetical protein
MDVECVKNDTILIPKTNQNMNFLEANSLPELPEDVLTQILNIYANIHLINRWAKRYQGFLIKHGNLNPRTAIIDQRGLVPPNKKTARYVNVLTGYVKYLIPRPEFNNYYDELFVETSSDLNKYKIRCNYCQCSTELIRAQCENCARYFCEPCAFNLPMRGGQRYDKRGLELLYRCPIC